MEGGINQMKKERFLKWLKDRGTISSYSINRYALAIDTISAELNKYGVENVNIYELEEPLVLERIIKVLKSDREFNKKNTNGNRMYSASLNHYKSFLEEMKQKEYLGEFLIEELIFEEYLKDIPSDNIMVLDKPKAKPNHKSLNNQRIWIRNPKIATESLVQANYLCEFDNYHKHFISKFNQRNYVEAHHLIPMSRQNHFDYSLDVHANIVSVCLVCHKKIHFGNFEDKVEILDKLFNERRTRLKESDISISLDQLYNYYKD